MSDSQESCPTPRLTAWKVVVMIWLETFWCFQHCEWDVLCKIPRHLSKLYLLQHAFPCCRSMQPMFWQSSSCQEDDRGPHTLLWNFTPMVLHVLIFLHDVYCDVCSVEFKCPSPPHTHTHICTLTFSISNFFPYRTLDWNQKQKIGDVLSSVSNYNFVNFLIHAHPKQVALL